MQLRVYRVCLGPLHELSDPAIPVGIRDNLNTLESRKDGKKSTPGKRRTPKLTTQQRCEIAQRKRLTGQRSGVVTPFDPAAAKHVAEIIDDLDTEWRGVRETWLYTLLIRYTQLLYERIRAKRNGAAE